MQEEKNHLYDVIDFLYLSGFFFISTVLCLSQIHFVLVLSQIYDFKILASFLEVLCYNGVGVEDVFSGAGCHSTLPLGGGDFSITPRHVK